ncbi:MAG: hypothetical protein K2N87_18515 [Eubacterium sp.]|nr:hypothetical protein [Eubacterium sp.]
MAAKLKNLKIRKVDFVDEGANPDAHIGMMKRKGADAHVLEDRRKKESGNVLKKLFGFMGKAAGIDQGEIDSVVDEIQKGDSASFNEKINEVNNRKIADEMWDICYALQSSLCSILNDEGMDSSGAAAAMQESLDEFYAAVQSSISKWSCSKEAGIVRKSEEVSEPDLEIMKSAVSRLNETIEKAGKNAEPEEDSEEDEAGNHENQKGDEEEMKIDKSKLTDAERAFLESIEKRYGTDGEAGPENGGAMPTGQPAPGQTPDAPVEPTITKAVSQPAAGTAPAQQEDETDSIYKGLHPAVRAELEGLKKFREAAEDRELSEVAKRYAIIGKKEEDLVPVLKNLRAAGGTAYDDMIAVLDQAVATVEKSGAFSEIGKSGHGSTDGSAWAEAEAKAVELMKSRTGLSKAQALDEILMADPELAAKCEKED